MPVDIQNHDSRPPRRRQAIRRGSFRSVKELISMIATLAAQWNEGSTPFAWVKTADQILAKAVGKPTAIGESGH